jgi:hypothetical protein
LTKTFGPEEAKENCHPYKDLGAFKVIDKKVLVKEWSTSRREEKT